MLGMAGLVAGLGHVVAGPDHLAALAPLAVEGRHHPARVGATWGLGHGLGVVILGALGQMLRGALDLQIASAWAEMLVGCLLIGLGIYAWVRAGTIVIHEHGHRHEGATHTHLHVHTGRDAKDHEAAKHESHSHGLKTAFGVGVLHGGAGVGHLFGVIPSLALSGIQAVAYLGTYLVGAVLGMALFGSAIGRITRAAGPTRVPGMLRTAGVVCFAVGLVWVAAIGIPGLRGI